MGLWGRVAATTLLVLAIIGGLAVPWVACAADSRLAQIAAGAGLAHDLGHVVCHQRPDRSFFSCGRQWPVCGRCAGLYIGCAAGAIASLLLRRRAGTASASTDQTTRVDATRWWRCTLVVVAAPTAALWALEFGLGIDPGSLVRFAGALPLGFGGGGWLAAIGRGDLR